MAKEFDFDELDKAVNSLMKDTEPPAPITNPETPVTEPTTVSPVTETVTPVEPLAPVSSEEPVAVEATTPVSPTAIPKPTGRFMDVVHPSSDMRTPSQTVAREGVAVNPISTVPISPEVTKPVTASAETEIAPDSVTLPPAPLTSPFLPDAQVEKRPLGGPSPEQPPSLDEAIAAELSADSEPVSSEATEPPVSPDTEPAIPAESITEPATESTSSPEGDTTPESEKENVGLPAELSNDLVAIESGEAQPENNDQLETPTDSTESSETAPSPAAALLSQSSIPQQYKEETSSTTEIHAPIYDDQTTAQAIPQAAKKGNKTRIILIAVIAVVVGIVGAAMLYYLQFGR